MERSNDDFRASRQKWHILRRYEGSFSDKKTAKNVDLAALSLSCYIAEASYKNRLTIFVTPCNIQ